MSEPHNLSSEEILSEHKVQIDTGLSSQQVEKLRQEHGFNELTKEEPTSMWKLVLAQFDDLLVKILLGAAVLSFVLALFEDGGEEGITAFVEPLVILLILILNAIVGVWQESNAEKALDALKELQSAHARVYRDGKLVPTLDAKDLVPGDIVEVRVGDKVPADCRILKLKTTTLKSDEASLTGESEPVMKHVDPIPGTKQIQEKKNCMFAGTTIANGAALAIITHTGMKTEIGKIQESVEAAKEDEEKTPLGQKLDAFGETLSKVIALICVLVWFMNFNQFWDPVHGHDGKPNPIKGGIYYLKIAVALGVAAIPEGLPAVITLCLALGTRKMVKKNAIIRKLPSVETLGCTTIICSDKTGTLTTNQMCVVSMNYFTNNGELKEHEVEGVNYRPVDSSNNMLKVKNFGSVDATAKGVVDLARVCALCNESQIIYDASTDKYERVGEPTEAALKILVEKIGVPTLGAPAKLEDSCQQCNKHWESQATKVATLEFSRDRKSMGVIVSQSSAPTGRATRSTSAGKNVLYVKGAPENVVERCTKIKLYDGTEQELTAAKKKQIMETVNKMAVRPLRTLAMAIKTDLGPLGNYDGKDSHEAHKQLLDTKNFASIESGMTLVGVCGIKDPARPEVKDAIERCTTAGIRVIMITGDNKATAEAIAKDIGIFTEGEDISKKSFTGAEFKSSTVEEQKQMLIGTGSRVFSRTEPKDKQDLVKILRSMGEVPAMTGDGVNDAPALKQAAIGVAMGIAGTEVAKEAADMILADDNFATIVSAVEEGRSIYSNMKAFIRYLISSNIGEVASIFLTALIGIPEGLIPVQLLWVNLVTDGPPATALGFNPPDADIMTKPPRRGDDKLIDSWVFFRYMVIGLYVGLATVGIFVYWYLEHGVTFEQLSTWGKCNAHEGIFKDFSVNNYHDFDFSKQPCKIFTDGKLYASTLSLTVLVAIEMFNALNALSEDGSLLQMPPWANPYLLLAMAVSFGLHFVILYIPFLAKIFSIVPLTTQDWWLVFLFSFPVILIDEVLKFIGRMQNAAALKKRLKHSKNN